MSEKIVLFVDDDKICHESFGMMLSLYLKGIAEVKGAYDGQQAIEMIKNGLRPKVIVTDYKMPYVSGLELLDMVNELSEMKEVIKIMVSGNTRTFSNGDLKELMEKRGGIFFTKPIGASEISEVIKEKIGKE